MSDVVINKPAQHELRIPCLDGLRALSIVLVILAHCWGTTGFPLNDVTLPTGDIGNYGVRVFFVISGFLITNLLIAEHAKSGTISLPMFYFRRTFRILPAFYGFILIIWLAQLLGWVQLAPNDLLYAITFLSNYHDGRAWPVTHLWSLAVEEQFYFVWPAVVRFVAPRRALWFALATMALGPVLRVASWVFFPGSRESVGETFHTVFDTLATGCVLALIRPRLDAWPLFTRIQRIGATPALYLLAALVIHKFHGYVSVSFTVGETATNVLMALAIDACVRNPTSLFGRFLELRPIVFVGVLSYSLYLAQQPFLNRNSGAWANAFPQNLVLAVAAALGSYYLVEKPFLNVRSRISKKWLRQKPRPQ